MEKGEQFMLENGKEECDCKKTDCVRHGKCPECIDYHNNNKRLPYCKRKKSILKNFLDIIKS